MEDYEDRRGCGWISLPLAFLAGAVATMIVFSYMGNRARLRTFYALCEAKAGTAIYNRRIGVWEPRQRLSCPDKEGSKGCVATAFPDDHLDRKVAHYLYMHPMSHGVGIGASVRVVALDKDHDKIIVNFSQRPQALFDRSFGSVAYSCFDDRKGSGRAIHQRR